MKKTTPNLRATFAFFVVCLSTTLTFSQNLYDSNGTIIWDATANSTFNNNVSFIGRDDAAGLNKKQNTDGTPQIGLGTIAASNAANPNSFATNLNFLVWGDNNGDMNDTDGELTITFNGTSGMSTAVDTPTKTWKIIENGGDIGTTRISIPTTAFSGLPALGTNDAYVMVIADNEAFSANVETVFFTTSGANQVADYDFDGVKFFTIGVAKQNTASNQVVLDGSDDYIKFGNVNNLAGSFTMMFWIKPNGQNELNSERTIVSKYNGTSGYRVYLPTNNKINVIWNGGTLLASNTVLPNGKWHNIALTFTVDKLSLYIDGVLDRTITTTAPTVNNNNFTLGAEFFNKNDVRNYFNGEIDEFRLWNRALSLTQLRFILNQEISQNASNTKGSLLPGTISKNDVSTIKWASLVAYYSMNSFIGSHINDDSLNNNRGYLVAQSEVNVAPQKAPIPYLTVANGPWNSSATWSVDSSVDAPNSLSIVNNTTPVIWNIVKTAHDITSTANNRVLGLIVDNNTYAVTNDTRLEITHYLKLNGKIDLVGRSQLIQILNSDLDPSSSGSLERDQQGQSNRFNYNYWSSPVGGINSNNNNQGFTLSNVLKDGTTSTPQTLNWTSGVNATATSPITLSKYWIFKFQDFNNGTANWSYVGNTGTIIPGQGFTLKGSGAATANQNYTFVGKPNNGNITINVLPNNLNLTGNPYPSAIDANKFIDDNATSITGTLYFWEHYSTNNSHASQEYQGGYATYTKLGGTAPVAPSGISGLGSSSKKPKRYIPVGQGFFVKGSITGGTISYKNSQRSFVKENSTSSYTMFRSATPVTNSDNEEDNGDTESSEELFMKIRLGYDSADQYHRETLIGFVNQYGSSNYDKGYDGVSMETLSNDMYFISGTYKLNILADGYFNTVNNYPLGVKNATQGNVKFSIDELENTEESLPIYLYDNVTNTYNNLREQAYIVNLPAGTFENRFSLRFSNGVALSTQDNLWNGLQITHAQNTQMVTIKNNALQLNISGVELYNLLGQRINTWSLDDQSQEEINLKVNQTTSGTYLVKVITNKGSLTKKIVL